MTEEDELYKNTLVRMPTLLSYNPDTILDMTVSRYTLEAAFVDNVSSLFISNFYSLRVFLVDKKELVSHFFDKKKEDSLSRDYQKALKKADLLSYLAISPMIVSQPESFKGHFTEYAKALLNAVGDLRKTRTNLIPVYITMLSSLVTDKSESFSIKDHTSLFKAIEKENESVIEDLKHFFPKSTGISKTTFGSVIERLVDLESLFAMTTRLTTIQSETELRKIKEDVTNCVDLLDMYIKLVKDGTIKVTPETANNISFGAREIGKHVELSAILYFDTLLFITAIDRLAESIVKIRI